MRQYKDLCRQILKYGEFRKDRTGTGTISLFGPQIEVDLTQGFPLLTTKDMSKRFKAIVHELLWFLRGDSHIRYLVTNGVNIWNADAHRLYREKGGSLSLPEFSKRLTEDPSFLEEHGDLGPVYGVQWRRWESGDSSIDQVMQVIEDIKRNPYSRRHIVSAWNVVYLEQMALPPCHVLFQFYVRKDEFLDCKLYQRSADVFLGVPFNIASYALLTAIIATLTGLRPGRFIHTFGDAHIYLNHVEQIKIQLEREEYPLPELRIRYRGQALEEFQLEDFELMGYQSHPELKGQLSVG